MFYERLLRETSADKDYFLSAPLFDDVLHGNFSLQTYLAFLHQAYHHVRFTVPLLRAARDGLKPSQRWVTSALDEYMNEEAGHEHWILDDIEACDRDRDLYAATPPGFATEMMVAYLFDYVERVNPMGIFGMVLVLEGTSSKLAPMMAKKVQVKLGLPDNAMTYLTTHGELDQEHIAHFERVMNKVEDEADQQAIIHVARQIYRLYGDVYRAIPVEAKQLAQAA